MNFISDISIWWLIPWSFLAVFSAWLLYRNVAWLNDTKPYWRKILIALRSISIFLIGLLLLGLLFESVSYRNEKPVFINLIDNSKSMLNYKDSSSVDKRLKQYLAKLNEKYGDRFDIINYSVGSEVKSNSIFKLNESKSALNAGFEKIRNDYYNRNIGGIAFVSDGNYNDGFNPIYTADQIALTPIFTIGVGDTIPKKDQALKSVVSNEIAFLRDQFPVQIDLEAFKIGKTSATVSISKNGKVIASQNVAYTDGSYDFKQVDFLLNADQIGFQQYTVSVSRIDNEYNYENNSRTFFIEVIDSRSKVLLLASAPNPDIAAVKSVLDQDENVKVQSVLLKDWDKSLKDVDLVVWHEPGLQFNQEVNNILLNSALPVWYFVGPNTNPSRLSEMQIGMNLQTRNQFDEVQAKVNTGFQEFDLSPELSNALNYFPPVKTKFGNVNLAGGAKILLNQQVGGIAKKEPLLYFGTRKNTKYAVFYGEGIWKWKIHEYAKNNNNLLFGELIQKIKQYLVLKQNTSALRITFPKRFSSDEEIIISGEFYNESLELINKPDIAFEYVNEKGKVYKNRFAKVGNKYSLSLGTLPKGTYTWKANTTYNGKSYAKSGNFVVEEINLESISTRADHGLLRAIANNSSGEFYELRNFEKMLNDLEKREDIATISYKESAFNDLIDYVWLLFCLLIILGFEWFLRRWLGAY